MVTKHGNTLHEQFHCSEFYYSCKIQRSLIGNAKKAARLQSKSARKGKGKRKSKVNVSKSQSNVSRMKFVSDITFDDGFEYFGV